MSFRQIKIGTKPLSPAVRSKPARSHCHKWTQYFKSAVYRSPQFVSVDFWEEHWWRKRCPVPYRQARIFVKKWNLSILEDKNNTVNISELQLNYTGCFNQKKRFFPVSAFILHSVQGSIDTLNFSICSLHRPLHSLYYYYPSFISLSCGQIYLSNLPIKYSPTGLITDYEQ